MSKPTVKQAAAFPGLRIDVEAEFGRNDYFIVNGLECLTDQLFIDEMEETSRSPRFCVFIFSVLLFRL